jgi:hypothetical protein
MKIKIIMSFLFKSFNLAIRNIKKLINYLIGKQTIAYVGMTSIGEQQFYTKCVRETSNTKGVIVDLGCWLCSTSLSLARGLHPYNTNISSFEHKIFAFDNFIWEN